MTPEESIIIKSIQDKAREVLPRGAHVWLYGSRARGDAHSDSDWDLLILLSKPAITSQDEDEVAYPLVVEGWKNNASISPQIYTYDEWERHSFTPYYKNVEHDKVLLQ